MTAIMNSPPPTLLTLPAELRNAIYAYVFSSTTSSLIDTASISPDSSPLALALALKLDHSRFHSSQPPEPIPQPQHPHLRILLTCRQIHHEAHLYAISHTTYHLPPKLSHPDLFFQRCAASLTTPAQLAALTHLTLTGKLASLRALNESWNNLPFGHPSLHLETLVLVPQRPEAAKTVWGELADLSQAHTLAYVFGETFKGLKNVRKVTVLNRECFTPGVFDLIYRTLVYRLFRWGGCACGVRFDRPAGVDSELDVDVSAFSVYFSPDDTRGREVGEEVCRLLGREGSDPMETDLALHAGVGL